MLKKAGTLTFYSGIQCCCLSSSPTQLPPPRARPRKLAPCNQRSYADSRCNTTDLWPEPKAPQTALTPYEILRLGKKETYSKHRFYELVKIYHPDRNGHEGCPEISHMEKMERYRLIIRAHEILSDPTKRREYDRVGAGWVGSKVSFRYPQPSPESSTKPFGTAAGEDASPFQNATWEDWERWYQRNAKSQDYTGNFLSPNAFASFVILLAVITGVAQATKAGQYSSSLEDRMRVASQETNNFLSSRADEHTGNGLDSEGRVKWFLEKRDPAKSGLKIEEEEAYKNTFPNRLPNSQQSTDGGNSKIDQQ